MHHTFWFPNNKSQGGGLGLFLCERPVLHSFKWGIPWGQWGLQTSVEPGLSGHKLSIFTYFFLFFPGYAKVNYVMSWTRPDKVRIKDVACHLDVQCSQSREEMSHRLVGFEASAILREERNAN